MKTEQEIRFRIAVLEGIAKMMASPKKLSDECNDQIRILKWVLGEN